MELTIHGATSIQAYGHKHHDKSSDCPSYSYRKIVVTNDRGETMTLNIFADSPDALNIMVGNG
jgi:hypothetical protein